MKIQLLDNALLQLASDEGGLVHMVGRVELKLYRPGIVVKEASARACLHGSDALRIAQHSGVKLAIVRFLVCFALTSYIYVCSDQIAHDSDGVAG